MYSIKYICIFVIISEMTIAESNYPNDLPKCHMGDNKCITEVIQLFIRNYSNGIPSINLPSLEPLLIGKIDVFREKKVDVLHSIINAIDHMDWKNSNVQLYGLKNATITLTGVEKNVNNSNVIITMFIPNATYITDYDLNLTFLHRQINGKGKLRFVSENLKIRWSFKLKLYEKNDGKQYIKIDQPKVDYAFTDASVLNFGTLFDGNEFLSRLQHIFLNQNCKLLIDTVKSEAEPEYARAFTDIVERIFSKFSIDELFLIDD